MQQEYLSAGLMNMIDFSYKSALENFNKACDKEPSYESLLYRAICHLKLGNYENSISDFNKAENTESSNKNKFSLYYNRGLALLYNSEIVFAKKDLQLALQSTDDITQKDLVNKVLIRLD